MESNRFEALTKHLKKGQIQACLIARNDRVIFDYFKNEKAESALHPIHSCTKSVVSMLFGICLREGLITDVNEPIQNYFKDHAVKFENSAKERITLYHLLTMTPGFDWPEFGKWEFGSPMEYSRDIIGFVLSREMEAQAGTAMNYNSGCSNLLSCIIQRVSGMKLADFAQKHLFSPLGISGTVWHEKQGICLGANGLKMKAGDMLKLGSLYLHGGRHKGEQIIPADWVIQSTAPHFFTYPNIGHYGYHWWASTAGTAKNGEISFYFALGLFGQYIIVIPRYKAVVVFVSENYGETMRPMGYFRDYIINEMDPE